MKLTEVLTSGDKTIAKDASGQLYVGSGEPRRFDKIDSYELRYDAQGNTELVNTVYSLSAS